ncbi:MAG TPA: GntR family transcriptional regulator [Terriglobia bacterium]|nr:GntR family transcriptional regulator [Terriglobia bacterium]
MRTRDNQRKRHERSGNLSHQAYYLIREKILTGKIPLGAPLSRRGLAAELGMSFLPISQALERLEYEELVESRPRVGTRVTMPTAQDVREHYILREALECQAARLFTEKASSEERLELQTMATRVDKRLAALGKKSGAETIFRTQAYHMSFHMRIVECTGSVALSKAIEKTHVLTFNWLYDISTKLSVPAEWHGKLMKALTGKNPEAAEKAMRRHINYGLRQIQETLAQQLGPDAPQFARLGTASPDGTAKPVPRGWRKRSGRRAAAASKK